MWQVLVISAVPHEPIAAGSNANQQGKRHFLRFLHPSMAITSGNALERLSIIDRLFDTLSHLLARLEVRRMKPHLLTRIT